MTGVIIWGQHIREGITGGRGYDVGYHSGAAKGISEGITEGITNLCYPTCYRKRPTVRIKGLVWWSKSVRINIKDPDFYRAAK